MKQQRRKHGVRSILCLLQPLAPLANCLRANATKAPFHIHCGPIRRCRWRSALGVPIRTPLGTVPPWLPAKPLLRGKMTRGKPQEKRRPAGASCRVYIATAPNRIELTATAAETRSRPDPTIRNPESLFRRQALHRVLWECASDLSYLSFANDSAYACYEPTGSHQGSFDALLVLCACPFSEPPAPLSNPNQILFSAA